MTQPVKEHSDDKSARTAHADCPRCGGTGKIPVDHLVNLAAKAWNENSDRQYPVIFAIKTLRGWTGCSLKEAKDAIDEVQRNASLVAEPVGGEA